nr:reverse transcriptase zinc-binding domain-containing protein [Tanacetum cinerariifolium]
MSKMPCNKSIMSILRKIILAAFVYCIWNERNNKLFGNGKKSYKDLLKIIVNFVRMKLTSLTVKNSSRVIEDADALEWIVSQLMRPSKTHKLTVLEAQWNRSFVQFLMKPSYKSLYDACIGDLITGRVFVSRGNIVKIEISSWMPSSSHTYTGLEECTNFSFYFFTSRENEEFSTKKVLSKPNVKVVFHQTAVPVTVLSTWIIYPIRFALGHSTRCLAKAWLSETTGTSSKKDNIFTSNSFSVLNDDEENEDEAVENVYDKSDNLLPNTKTGENSSFTAAAG